MAFQALTNAPILREGVSLSFMAIPQTDVDPPRTLEMGVEVTLRLGFCCPDIRYGRITAISDVPTRATLALGGDEWTLEPRPATEANTIPGIRSEIWLVR